MAWVITRLCRDCLDMGCVKVCPVDCIYEYTGADRETYPNQLFIDPDECINCSVCEPECPWEAIFEDSAVPEPLKDDIALNGIATAATNETAEVVLGGTIAIPAAGWMLAPRPARNAAAERRRASAVSRPTTARIARTSPQTVSANAGA